MDAWFDIGVAGHKIGRLAFKLFTEIAPKTCENFRALCMGDEEGQDAKYKGCRFHRVIPGFMIQGGDFTNGDGTGGESIFGKTFEDEPFVKTHDKRGLLSMANCGPDTNGLQFFITFGAAKHLDGKHVVFGEVVEGLEVLDKLEKLKTNSANDKPIVSVTILDCGGGEKDGAMTHGNVEKQIQKHTRKLDKESERLAKAAEGMSFPVPTMDNPTAMYADAEARRLAQEKLDEKNLSALQRSLAGGGGSQMLSARKQKLLDLKRKQMQARAANQEQVVEEHRRLNVTNKKLSQTAAAKEKEKQEQERLVKLKSMGVDEKKAYLLETAEKAQKEQAKKEKKLENMSEHQHSHSEQNQDTLYRSYNKKIAQLDKLQGGSDGAQSTSIAPINAFDYGTQTTEITEDAKQRLAKLIEPSNKRKRAKARLDEEDVNAINDRNERFNRAIAKSYDKYTVEIRQNLERGTNM